MNRKGIQKWKQRAFSWSIDKGGDNQNEKKKVDGNWLKRFGLLYVDIPYVKPCLERLLVIPKRFFKDDRVRAIIISAMIPLPIVLVWLLFCHLLMIPNDVLRTVGIWSLIFLLFLLAGYYDVGKGWKHGIEHS